MPPRLSEFDREQFFTLTSADVAALREQFRSDHRLPAALMLMFMRVAGRPLDGFNVLPRNLLRHTAQVLAVSPPSIASLRSIYKRRQTLSKHQLWAKNYLGLRELELDDEAALTSALLAQAADASHADDLVQSASHWLFTRRILIPGARRLQDWARDAFAAVEAQILSAVNAAVPPTAAQRVIDAAYSARPGADTTNLEWLKTPSKRHGPSTRAETIDKIRYLKELGAHDWTLSAVSLAKQQAYARQVQARRPVKTREIKPSRQLIELVCFLRVTLLELTDVALLQSNRRSQQLFREAADKAQSNRVRGTTGLIQQAAKARPSCTTNPRPGRRESWKPENCSPSSAKLPAAALYPRFARLWRTTASACTPAWLRCRSCTSVAAPAIRALNSGNPGRICSARV